MDIPIFLIHLDPAGVKTYTELERYAQRAVFYLPDTSAQEISISRDKDDTHSTIKLEVETDYSLLSDFGNTRASTIVLGATCIELPLSTASHQKSIILTQQHQFITPAGRWMMEWDTDNQISNSMRPPTLPLATAAEEDFHESDIEDVLELVPLQQGGGLINLQEFAESPDAEEHTPVPVTEIHLSPGPSDTSESIEERIESESPTPDHKENAAIAEQTALNVAGAHRQLNESMSKSSDTLVTDPGEGKAQINKPQESGPDSEDIEMLDCGVDEHQVFEPPNVPKAWREQQEADEMEVSATASVTEITVSLGDDVSNLHDRSVEQVSPPHHQCVQEKQTSEDGQDDEETVSEDDSPLPKDSRKLKRSLCDIEEGDSPLYRKKARIDQLAAPTKDQEESHSSNDTVDSIAGSEASAKKPVKKKVSWDDSGHGNQHMPTLRDRGLQDLATPPTPESTPRTSSRRRSVTPVNSLTNVTENHGYGSPKVIFGSTSTIPGNKRIMSVIARMGGSVVSDITEADVLCIGKGSIKKTSKFVIAVAKGKDIVTDDWLKQAHADKKFPHRQDFLPKDKKHEKEWKFKLAEAIERGKQGLNLLEGVHIHLTSQLRQDLGDLTKELKQVAVALGATATHNGLPKKNAKGQVLVIGSSKNVDPDAANVGRLGHRLYGQDILTMAALRGHLELESSEFMLDVPVKEEMGSD